MMTRRSVIALMLLAGHTALYASPLAPAANSNGSAWTVIREALAQERKGGRKLLLFFSADWCAPCRQLDAALREPATAAALRRRLRLVKVDVGHGTLNHDVARHFGVDLARAGVPALVAVDPQNDLRIPLDIVLQDLAAARRGGARALDEYFARLTEVGC